MIFTRSRPTFFIVTLLFTVAFVTPIAVFSQSSAQQTVTDSLTQTLAQYTEQNRTDTATVNLLNRLAREYFTRTPEKALGYARRAVVLADKLGDVKAVAQSISNIGAAYFYQGKYDVALENHLAALRLRDSIGDKQGEAASLNNIGLIYAEQSKYDLALEYHQKALKLREGIGDKQGMSSSYSNIGLIYSDRFRFDEAKENFVKALGIFREIGDKQGEASLLNNIGKILTIQSNYIEALECYNQSLQLKKQTGNQEGQCSSLNNISNVYIEQKKYHEALKYSLEALELAETIGAKLRQQEALESISEIYSALGDKGQALEYYKRFVGTRNEILSQESQNKALQLQAQYESEKKDQEIKLLTKDNELQGTVRNSLLAGGALLVVLLGLMIRRYREKKRANEEILRQQQALEEQAREITIFNLSLEEKNEQLGEKNREIMDSIFYAERIQSAVLPHQIHMLGALSEHFILYKPRDIVSGDFYWCQTIRPNGSDDGAFVIVAAVDCTGHGVPGAFMSMIGNSTLNQIVMENHIYDPARILEELHIAIRSALQQDEEEDDGNNSRDGMDICLCRIDRAEVTFAGAKRPLYIMRPNADIGSEGAWDVEEIKGDKVSIGGKQKEERRTFTNHTRPIDQEMALYLTTDGFIDQPNPNNDRYGSRRLKTKLAEMALLPARVQRQTMLNELKQFQSSTGQRDDITIVGLKLRPDKIE